MRTRHKTVNRGSEKLSILYLGAGPAMPASQVSYRMKYEKLSEVFNGHIITPVAGEKHLLVKRIGAFSFHPYMYLDQSAVLRNVKNFIVSIMEALRLRVQGCRIDAVVSPNPLMSGVVALFIGRIIFHIPVIIEVNGNFAFAFSYNRMGDLKLSTIDRIKKGISKNIISFVVGRADRVKLLYPEQINFIGHKKNRMNAKIDVFSNYVPSSLFKGIKRVDKKYILFIGYPWNLKGVDILIQAFNLISNKYNDYNLKIVGWCPENKEFYEGLAAGNERIEFHDPVFYEGVIRLMRECSLFILPSRTEGMGRVLLEAMASEKPIVASNVDGIPYIIKDGQNGLLFESENIEELAEKMSIILEDAELKEKLANTGKRYLDAHLSEQAYVSRYHEMVKNVVNRKP